MTKNSNQIPVRSGSDDVINSITITRISSKDYSLLEQEAQYDHRHDSYYFVFQESGTMYTEIDSEKQIIKESSIYYQTPQQVHKITKAENIELHVLSIYKEHLEPEYLSLLQRNPQIKPIILGDEELNIIRQAFILCAKIYERKADKLYLSQLRNCCNSLVALIISQFLKEVKPIENLNRFELITKNFTELLENNFLKFKQPTHYAEMMNISVPYLNKCIKETTGHTTSHIIQQRIILEAKRLLYHTDKTVKEIAIDLGYDDYAYFSRLFTKAVGMTAISFREKTALN